MAGRFVRASKYRHVFGRPTKKEQCYDGLRISQNAWDTNLIKVNPQYLSVNWESGGGGAFAVIPLKEKGRLPEQMPLFQGHTAAVLDTDWSPFDDTLIASGSDDAKVFIWKVPEDFTLYSDAEEPAHVSPVGKLTGHSRKVGHVMFNPSAENLLASSSGDCTIKLWDVENAAARLTLKHKDIVQSLSWSADGSLLVTTCRDKKLRLWDVRQEKPAHEVAGHPGAKNSRAVWMGEHDRIATTGFSRMSDRQLGLWDARAPTEPIGGFQILDSISGVCMPFWDDGTNCLYLAGKGDGNIRYFEYVQDKFEYLSEHKSADPQRGVAFLPKRGVSIHENEVMRAYRTVNDTHVEPVSFIVPRRAEVFQEDIFPPTVGVKPSMSASEWFDGKEGLPPKISLESVYEGEEPAEVPADYKPRSTSIAGTAAAATVATVAAATTAVTAATAAGTSALNKAENTSASKSTSATLSSTSPPTSAKEAKNSIARMAAKYAGRDKEDGNEEEDDDDDDDDDDETSSFEEVPKPAERPASGGAAVAAANAATASASARNNNTSLTSRVEEKLSGPQTSKDGSGTPASVLPASHPLAKASQDSAQQARQHQQQQQQQQQRQTSSSGPTGGSGSMAGVGSGSGSGLSSEDIRSDLRSIKSLLEQQTRTMSTQADQIARLTAEVGILKNRVVSGGGGGGSSNDVGLASGATGSAGDSSTGGTGPVNTDTSASALAEKDEKIRRLELELEELQS